jgi:methylated-DNA-[protein]-cysteine S-methyltransferase
MKKVIQRSLFCERVYDTVRSIPRGSVMSYAEVASNSGAPGASRAVGTLMKNNYDITIPCHRVVKSNGEVGEYNRGGMDTKIKLLKKEGVYFKDGKHVILPRT